MPQRETRDEHNQQVMNENKNNITFIVIFSLFFPLAFQLKPPGLCVITLPYADDIRHLHVICKIRLF